MHLTGILRLTNLRFISTRDDSNTFTSSLPNIKIQSPIQYWYCFLIEFIPVACQKEACDIYKLMEYMYKEMDKGTQSDVYQPNAPYTFVNS